MTSVPTRGATEETSWQARRGLAIFVRCIAFVVPIAASILVLRFVSGVLLRPSGWQGIVLWIAQAAPISAATSLLVDRGTRRLLPLATLLDLSMVFPDQAPSRFSMALRAGTVKKLGKALDEVKAHGLGNSESEAATNALQLVTLLGSHDRLTRGHSERVRAYADLIAQELGFSPADRLRLAWGVLLHDMGKLTVPESVLNKRDKLTDEEWQLLKNHPAEGIKLLAPLADWLGDWVHATDQHHERWDGNGYPHGLSGANISLAGRITAVADAYDVITSKRSYKSPMSVTAARKELVSCAGTQFDPDIVRAFLTVSLGRRWTFGPLAWLSDLPIGHVGTMIFQAPVIAATGTILAVSTLTVALPDIPPDEPLAFVETSDEGSVPPPTSEPNAAVSTSPPDTQTLEIAESTTDSPDSSGSGSKETVPAPTSIQTTTSTPTRSFPSTTRTPAASSSTTTTTSGNIPTTTTAATTTTTPSNGTTTTATTQPTTTTTAATTTTCPVSRFLLRYLTK